MSDQAKVSQVVTPGVCPPEGCPPPTRIECIVVDKVYDSCFQLDSFTRDFTVEFGAAGVTNNNSIFVGQNIPCELDDITCQVLNRVPVNGGFMTLTILVTITLKLTNPNYPTDSVLRSFTFIKTVTLCCPDGVDPDCSESTIFCTCAISAINETELTVTCNIQVCLVIKCILTVQLLVPSYGFCVPAPCIALPGVCPPAPPAQCF